MKDMIQRLNIDRSVAACGWRMAEIKELPDAILEVFRDLMEDVENNSDWPGIMLEVLTAMIPKEADPNLEEISPDGLAVPEATEMRPINNASPWYSIWSGTRFQHMAPWREAWMPDSMHGSQHVTGTLDEHAVCGGDGHTESSNESRLVKVFRQS